MNSFVVRKKTAITYWRRRKTQIDDAFSYKLVEYEFPWGSTGGLRADLDTKIGVTVFVKHPWCTRFIYLIAILFFHNIHLPLSIGIKSWSRAGIFEKPHSTLLHLDSRLPDDEVLEIDSSCPRDLYANGFDHKNPKHRRRMHRDRSVSKRQGCFDCTLSKCGNVQDTLIAQLAIQIVHSFFSYGLPLY